MPKSDTVQIRKKGRPALTQEQRLHMREKISSAALKLFLSEGYGAISMRRLAKEVSCTPMTLYKYYENKFEILHQLWAEVFEDLFAYIEKTIASNTAAVGDLDTFAQAYVTYWLNHKDRYRMVFMTEGVTQSEVSHFVADAQTMSRFAIVFQAVAQATHLPVDDPAVKIKAEILISSLNGILLSILTIPGYEWSEPATLVSGVVAGILKT